MTVRAYVSTLGTLKIHGLSLEDFASLPGGETVKELSAAHGTHYFWKQVTLGELELCFFTEDIENEKTEQSPNQQNPNQEE